MLHYFNLNYPQILLTSLILFPAYEAEHLIIKRLRKLTRVLLANNDSLDEKKAYEREAGLSKLILHIEQEATKLTIEEKYEKAFTKMNEGFSLLDEKKLEETATLSATLLGIKTITTINFITPQIGKLRGERKESKNANALYKLSHPYGNLVAQNTRVLNKLTRIYFDRSEFMPDYLTPEKISKYLDNAIHLALALQRANDITFDPIQSKKRAFYLESLKFSKRMLVENYTLLLFCPRIKKTTLTADLISYLKCENNLESVFASFTEKIQDIDKKIASIHRQTEQEKSEAKEWERQLLIAEEKVAQTRNNFLEPQRYSKLTHLY